MGKNWKKYKCAFCGYEIASAAKKPRCTKGNCRSTRLNEIEKFSTTTKQEVEKKMADEKQEIPKPAPEIKRKQEKDEIDDIDEDILGEDEDILGEDDEDED